jgi:hypothetical protein
LVDFILRTKGAAPRNGGSYSRGIPGIDFFNWTSRKAFAKVNASVAARSQRCQLDIPRLDASFLTLLS